MATSTPKRAWLSRRVFFRQALSIGATGAAALVGARLLTACDKVQDLIADATLPDVNVGDVTMPDLPTELPGLPNFLDALKLGDAHLIADVARGRVFRLYPEEHAVTEIDLEGRELWRHGGFGAGDEQLSFPSHLVPTGDAIYVVDRGNHRVVQLDPSGARVKTFGSHGSEVGQLAAPRTVAVGKDGTLWVTDELNHRVHGFSPDGEAGKTLGGAGSDQGQLNGPRGIDVDGDGNLHVVDAGNARIQVFTPDGVFVRAYGSFGGGNGQELMPRSVAIGPLGYSYVSDPASRALEIYDTSGAHVARFDDLRLADLLAAPLDVSLQTGGLVYVRLHTWAAT